jgi:hypothetical protein
MFPAVGQNLKLGRGSLLLAPYTGGVADAGYIFMGNIPSLEFSWELETREKKSATQSASPLIASATIRQDLSLVAQCDEHIKENMKKFFFGTEATADQTLSTTGSYPITDVLVGRVYDVGSRQITNVVAKKGSTVLVNGTDYTLYGTSGQIIFLDTATVSDGDDLTVEFDRPVVTVDRISLGRVSEQLAKIMFIADDANSSGIAAQDRFMIPKVQVTPDGAYQLISDDYTSFSLRFRALSDSTVPASPLGWFERVRAA